MKEQKNKDQEPERHPFFERLHRAFDWVMFILALAAALGFVAFDKARSNSGQNEFVRLSKPKEIAKKTKIPKSQIAWGEVYELIPKKKVDHYQTVTDENGYSYEVKRKHPKVTWKSYFYLDPNQVSKDKPVEKNLYLLITGCVVPAIKTPKTGQYNFVDNTSLAFDSTKHYVLNDSQTYIQVMQLKSYSTYGNQMAPNATNNTFNLTINVGSTPYLKLSEFKLKRLKKQNLSHLAQQMQLFSGFAN
ncbi:MULTISPECIES: hypothetical protein [Lactobacillus]|uniref:Uncharacterized protein n=1 Tax=Lactobacillus xujianguonis TaxID=2495899 RepID=A0A437STZ4_9LACO|nr:MULTISPECIES: hypothetical protein [Lactobacillus]RVU70403.1 hypothetical protein EJK17_07775 [Lactobacillus xujianguonis]RVU73650.1 hypothetical protein EJK20_07100 [Lactobacillus xujianguonis]